MFGRQDSISNKSNDKQKNSGTGKKGQKENIIDQILSTGNENASQVLVDEDNQSGNIFDLDEPKSKFPAESRKKNQIESKTKNKNIFDLDFDEDEDEKEDKDRNIFDLKEPKEKSKSPADSKKKNQTKSKTKNKNIFDLDFDEDEKEDKSGNIIDLDESIEKSKSPAESKKKNQIESKTKNKNIFDLDFDEDEDEKEDKGGNIFNLDSPTENIIVPAENKKQKNLDSGKKTTQKISLEDEDDISGFLNEPSDDESEEESDEIKGPQQDIYPGDNEAKQEFYQDPPEVVNRLKEQDENDLLEEDTESTRTVIGKRKKLKNLRQADADQKRIAGLNILVQKLPARNKAGAIRRFFTKAALVLGNTIGKAINWIGAGIARIFNKNYREKYRRGQSLDPENQELLQQNRRHDLIPGWNGETFQRDPDRQDDILADFRRVPTVWSRLTAGMAEDKSGKPLAPKVSIYVRKGNEAEDKITNGLTDAGHTWIGIEYSRYSRRFKRYERYNLKYGFYPANDQKKGTALSMTKSAVIPGKLSNDYNSVYTVSRSYPASAYQVNKILKASETYADKGYNAWKRNCTTFVKDMVQGEAKLPVGDKIFEQEEPGLSFLQNVGIFAAKSSENTEMASMEDRFHYLNTQQDISYAGDGNLRMTKQDYRQYKQSMTNKKGTHKKGTHIGPSDIPNAVAENMRREEGQNSGTIGSKQYFGIARPKADDNKLPESKLINFHSAITHESDELINKILSFTGKRSIEELCETPGIDKGIKNIFRQIRSYSTPLNNLKVRNPKKLREARAQLEKSITDLNSLLYGFFQNDARLHLPVMHLISLLEFGIDFIDDQYQIADIGKNAYGDMGDVYTKMRTKIPVSYHDENTGQTISTEMSPSHFESYLQIYKTPKQAIDQYSRYLTLKNSNHRTAEDEKEFKKLKRIEKAAYEYDSSHNYMIEKQEYSQQDVDYAFKLSNIEKQNDTSGMMIANSSAASNIYQGLILEKIFGGVSQRFENHFTLDEAGNEEKIGTWLDEDMCKCINNRTGQLETVIKALDKSMPDPTEKELLEQLMNVIEKNWIKKVFDPQKFLPMQNKRQNKIFAAKYTIWAAFVKIKDNSKLKTRLAEAIHEVMEEKNNLSMSEDDNLIHI